MAKAAWGKPTIQIGAPDETGKTFPTKQGLQTLASVKENSTKIETQEGDKKELKGEGGVVLDVRRGAPSASLETEVFVLKGEVLPKLLKDSKTVSVLITPEDPDTVGVFIPMASVAIAQQWTTEEGASYKIRFEPVLAKETEGVQPVHFTKSGAIFDPFTGTK